MRVGACGLPAFEMSQRAPEPVQCGGSEVSHSWRLDRSEPSEPTPH